jgi:hypothetical protein
VEIHKGALVIWGRGKDQAAKVTAQQTVTAAEQEQPLHVANHGGMKLSFNSASWHDKHTSMFTDLQSSESSTLLA